MLRNDDGDAHGAERMLNEARLAARIEHPAIIRVFDFGVTERGDPFLVMELLSGPTLRERLLREGRVTPTEAVRLLLPVADAISAAHGHGVVHRDLKPDNIVCVTESAGRCQPKVIDFGIAKQVQEQSIKLTLTGTVLGSPEYMSPEQARGLPDVDHKTDIWAFSVMLYELITGTTPFLRDGAVASVLHAIMEEPPRPLADLGIHDQELSSIIALGLEKSPAGRWKDMRTLGTALAEWLLRRGVEEDVCAQSVRMVWLGTRSSAPPVTLDHHVDDERARLSALPGDYEVPKKSIPRTTLGIAATVVTVTLIGVAGFFTAGASRDVPRDAPAALAAAPLLSQAEGQLAIDSPPMGAPGGSSSPAPSASPATIPGPSAGAPGALAPKPLVAEPAVGETRKIATARHPDRYVPAFPTRARPMPARSAPAYESFAPGQTTLPEPTPPPELGSKASDSPYVDDGAASGKVSDNPY